MISLKHWSFVTADINSRLKKGGWRNSREEGRAGPITGQRTFSEVKTSSESLCHSVRERHSSTLNFSLPKRELPHRFLLLFSSPSPGHGRGVHEQCLRTNVCPPSPSPSSPHLRFKICYFLRDHLCSVEFWAYGALRKGPNSLKRGPGVVLPTLSPYPCPPCAVFFLGNVANFWHLLLYFFARSFLRGGGCWGQNLPLIHPFVIVSPVGMTPSMQSAKITFKSL